MTQPVLRLSGISRHYSAGDEVVRALDGVSLDVYAGEFVAIMGQSGSGKSTLMNMIGCLDRPSAGSYLVEGREVSTLDRDAQAALRSRLFGFIYQRYNLMESLTAKENVELPAIYAGMKKDERIERAETLLKSLGLGERMDNRPSGLSGGQQQRVAIARALVNNPAIILADEPTGALDSRSGEEVMALLARLHADGHTVIVITHDEKIAAHAQRQIRIADGKILSDTGADDRHAQARSEEVTCHAVAGAEMIEAVKMATRSLRMNMFRTLLTLLGIVIGVASVVVMLAVGDGSKQKVLDQITAMGTNLIMVRPGAPGVRPTGDVATLVLDDAEAIAALPNIEGVVPERSGNYTVRRGLYDASVNVMGTNWQQSSVNSWPVVQGGDMTEGDYRRMAPIALIGQTVKTTFFPDDEDPIGKTILIKNIPFEVVGVKASKGASMFGSDQDNVIFIPLTTGNVRLFGRSYLNNLTVRVTDVTRIEETQKAMGELLLERHRVEDFSVRNMSSFLQMASETQNTLKILLGAVALISLLVGGIGVMNIMLVSVTERTREIGVRVATGARMRDIMLQFMTEAVVVCLTGGLLGVGIGVGIALVVDNFGMATLISLPPILLSFICAVSTGLLFGYLPARKAARLDPVVALAAE